MSSIKNTQFPLNKQKSLLLEMIRMDFKLRYQSSVLGYLWSILKPLFIFAILYTIFGKVLKLGANVPNYALSLLLGIVLWNFFSEATSGALKSIVGKGSLIRKIDIPRYLIPIAMTASAFINMILNLTVVFLFLAFAQINAVSWATLIVFPLLIIELVILTLGVSFFLAAVYVKLRDIDYIWDVVKQALFYAIPIIYPLSRVPSETIQQFMMMNPLVQIIQDARSVITYDGTEQIPDIFSTALFQLIPLSLVIASLLIGVTYFMKKAKYFAEQV